MNKHSLPPSDSFRTHESEPYCGKDHLKTPGKLIIKIQIKIHAGIKLLNETVFL